MSGPHVLIDPFDWRSLGEILILIAIVRFWKASQFVSIDTMLRELVRFPYKFSDISAKYFTKFVSGILLVTGAALVVF